jgi:hypothetical protein
MPLASGLGSSGASSVAAAVVANELLGRPFARADLLASAMEGERAASGSAHADNVAPGLLGGIVLVRSYEPLELVSLPVPPGLWMAVAHPHCELPTSTAREVVKAHRYAIAEVVANLGNVGALVSALHAGDLALLGRSIEDVLVEPLRAPLIPAFAEVKAVGLRARRRRSGRPPRGRGDVRDVRGVGADRVRPVRRSGQSIRGARPAARRGRWRRGGGLGALAAGLSCLSCLSCPPIGPPSAASPAVRASTR